MKKFICSWSGGKDSCLALHHALGEGTCVSLLTMMTEGGVRSRSHGLSLDVLRAQAAALQLPLVPKATSWNDYEATFVSSMREFGLDGVFGDIDIDSHREWVVRVCEAAGVRAHHPIWKRDRIELLEEFIGLGFRAVIISIKEGTLEPRFLGQTLTRELVPELQAAGIDPSGEGGEYHTVVTDGPLFREPVRLTHGDQVVRDGYRFLDATSEVPFPHRFQTPGT